jgi:hypothetical protein
MASMTRGLLRQIVTGLTGRGAHKVAGSDYGLRAISVYESLLDH